MSLFQSSVVAKYLNTQNKEIIATKWQLFKNHFQNPTIQENIRNSKEEQYQGGFIIDLFVNILGYTKNPAPNFNIITEQKNVKDAKKADGAIIINNKIKAVVELKGTETTDLNKVETQAFGYKNNQPECTYVITSNFEKLRFYIDNAIEHIEFNLFTLSQQQFELLFLCLAYENIANDIPKKLKEQSVSHEDVITKTLYKDYSLFKRELHQNLVVQNPQIDELTLFKKSQKLLDRFLFLFFAEDRKLLPPNSVRLVLSDWKDLIERDAYKPLYQRFKKYFGYLNTGFNGKRYNVFAYNGGLFKPDEVLDAIKIDDELLYKHTLKLSEYDFDSEVDVNILGHIFENSLTEIEEIQSKLEGQEVDKKTSKRKKDGVFYTPKYITKYIVENTIGKLCEEKKKEFDISDETYKPAKQRSRKRINNLQQYRDWLLQLTICDPACGSGAFLNQALDYLITEHRYIDELSAKYNKDAFVLSDVEKSILENNLFGVDLNEESVEIAKLSLWLRTAQPNRKLNDLSNNIKCGNSLIDDVAVAGDKAFNWQQEFPHIFTKGGFDVVIGNPPYVRQELFKEIKSFLEENYTCYNSVADLYTYFIEKGINLINSDGLHSFILPNKFLKATYGKQIRKVLKENTNIELLFDFDDYPVFDDATTYPIIYVLNKKNNYKKDYFIYSEINKRNNINDPISLLKLKKHNVPFKSLTEEMWNFVDINSFNLIEKLKSKSNQLGEFVSKKIFYGIKTGKNEAFIINEEKKEELIKLNPKNSERIKILATGKEIKRNSFNFQNKYLLFTGFNDDIPKLYPDIQVELDKYKEALIKRYDQGENYWNLRACAYYKEMQQPKIIYPRINSKGNFYLDEKGDVFLLDNNFFISTNSKSLLALLNSKLIFFYLKNICTTLQGGFYDFRRDKITTIPISNNINKIDNALSHLSENLIVATNESSSLISKFQRTLKRKFELEKLSKKLQNWYLLPFADFVKELKKKKIKLSLQQEAAWEDYFLTEQQKATTLKQQIETTDKEIDAMVYELYGVTKEEIKIVEES